MCGSVGFDSLDTDSDAVVNCPYPAGFPPLDLPPLFVALFLRGEFCGWLLVFNGWLTVSMGIWVCQVLPGCVAGKLLPQC